MHNSKDSTPILKFEKEYHFLSNFHPSPIKAVFNNIEYSFATGEHLFQGAKFFYSNWDLDRKTQWLMNLVKNDNPNKAKYAGRSIQGLNITTWDRISFNTMKRVQYLKYEQNLQLKSKLMLTGDRELIEGNHWNDKLWGVSHGEGKTF